MVRRPLARWQNGMDDHNVVVFQLHVVVGFLNHGNRSLLSRGDGKREKHAKCGSEKESQDHAP